LKATKLGGGKKKVSLAKMEKSQTKKSEKRKEAKSSGSTTEKKTPDIFMPDTKSGKIIEEVKKLKVLTPFAVASRFNLRLSIAKDFLEELESKGIVQLVSKSRNVRVYKPLD